MTESAPAPEAVTAAELSLAKGEYDLAAGRLVEAHSRLTDAPEALRSLTRRIEHLRVQAEAERKARRFRRLADEARSWAYFNRDRRKAGAICEEALASYSLGHATADDGSSQPQATQQLPAELHKDAFELLLILARTRFDSARAKDEQAKADRLQKALATLAEARELREVSPAVMLYRAQFLKRSGKEAAAVQEEQRAAETKPQTALDHFLLGGLRSGDSVAHYKSALQIEPDHAPSYMRLGQHYKRSKQTEQAELCFTACAALLPENPFVFFYRGKFYQEIGQPDGAVDDYTKAMQLRPDFWAYHELRGCAYAELQRYREAVDDFTAALKLSRNRRWEEAAGVLQKFGKLDCTDPHWNSSLAWWLATWPDPQFRDPQRAVELAGQAIELQPEDPGHWSSLGTAHYRAGDWEDAIAALAQYNEYSHDTFFLAMAHWQLGHWDEASRLYEKAVERMEKETTEHEHEEDYDLIRFRDDLIRFRAEAAQLLGRPRLISPQDNHPPDLDPVNGQMLIPAAESGFKIEIASLADPVDDTSVTSRAARLLHDGRPLREGVDYRFQYEPESDLIQLLPLDGPFGEGTYRINLGDGAEKMQYQSGHEVPPVELTVVVISTLPVGQEVTLRQGVAGYDAVSHLRRKPSTLVPKGATWKYLADGSDQGSAWRDPEFDDSAWEMGPAQLGHGDGDEVTVVGPRDENSKFITTYYFRHAFQVADPGEIKIERYADDVAALVLHLLRDDGAAIYLNGQEVVRDGLEPYAGHSDFSTQTIAGVEESTFVKFVVDPGLLVEGTNYLAVEIHQVGLTSSDISFDLQLTAAGYGLLRFDKLFGDDAGKIPLGSLIQHAQLSLHPGIPASSLNLYQNLKPWPPDNRQESKAVEDARQNAALNWGNGKFDVTASVQAWADG